MKSLQPQPLKCKADLKKKKKRCWPLLDPIRVAMSDERTLKGPYYSHN